MIKLSKTFNSTIIITNNDKQIVLNKTSLYYKLEDDFHSKLLLEIKDNNAFIEFLSQNDNYELLEDILLTSHLVKNKTTVIKIPYTQKDFILAIQSDKIFKYSLSLELSTSKDYFYISNSNRELSVTNQVDGIYKEYYKLNTPFRDINLIENEFLSLAINIDKSVYIAYYQNSKIDLLLNEKLNETYCEKVKKKYFGYIRHLCIYRYCQKST
jgi:hypothetical protein